jgi:putative radical SAM enzyme (TIGR03279 family)
MVRIAGIRAGSIADELELRIGSRIVRINGTPVRDVLDFQFLEVDGRLEVEVFQDDGPVLYDIEKPVGESLGVVPAPDKVRECANKCVFCFIDGNPPGVRQSLYLRDDDFRLSFTHGSYVTLTNLGPRGFQRLVDQRLSPLYVSVHATEPEVRMRLLDVPHGGDIVDRLRNLTGAGIDVHTQVVLCPGWNDGAHLDRTLQDLWSLGPHILSVSVVPVGLTRYNLDRPVRLLTGAEAAQALRQVERAREKATAERGTGWAYASDELFFTAGRPVPPGEYYDDWPLTENGVGAVRSFLDALKRGFPDLPRLDGRRLAFVTGARMGEVMVPIVPRLHERTGARLSLLPVENRLFGPTVTTAGLLPGADIAAAVEQAGPFDDVLLPAESLNDDGLFIDSMSLVELRGRLAGARAVAGYELAAALSQL